MCATNYGVFVLHKPAGAKLEYHWYIQLKLVDSPGAGAPDTPGSAAAFDPACTNAELPGGKVDEGKAGQSGVVYRWDGLQSLDWYHGDAGTYRDNPSYGCDHMKQGPSGHQGIVTLVVDDVQPGAKYTPWVCQANYYGTNTGVAPEEDTDCHPESESPGERFLLAVAWNDEITAKHMLQAKHPDAAKSEIEHSLSDLKQALAKEKSFPLPLPFFVHKIETAIKDDEQALAGDKAALQRAIDAKDDLLADFEDDDGDAPPPVPLPFFGK